MMLLRGCKLPSTTAASSLHDAILCFAFGEDATVRVGRICIVKESTWYFERTALGELGFSLRACLDMKVKREFSETGEKSTAVFELGRCDLMY